MMLNSAADLRDLKAPPNNYLETLKNDRKGQHSIASISSTESALFSGKETPSMSKFATTIKKVLLSLDESEELLRAAKSVPLAPAEVTPGEILLEEFMKPLGLSGNALAKRMNVDPMRVNEIVRGKRATTAETALRLAAIFGTSARFWLGLQK